MSLITLLDILKPHQKITIVKQVAGDEPERIIYSGKLRDFNPQLNEIIGYNIDAAFFRYGDEISLTVC